MRIAQISDFHFTRLSWNPFHLISKRILSNLNWTFFRKDSFFEEQVFELPALFSELKVDLVLLGGDISTSATKKEFSIGEQFLKNLKMPWIAIPGNHDKYTYKSCRENHFYQHFENRKKDISCKADFFNLKNHRVEVHNICPGWQLIALDTALATNPYSSQGMFSEKLQSYLEELLSLLPPDDSVIILNHYPLFQNDEERRELKRSEALRKLIEKNPRIQIYLHGHTHRHSVADLRANNLPLVLDSGSCANGSKASFNLLDLQKDHMIITPYFRDKTWVAKKETLCPLK